MAAPRHMGGDVPVPAIFSKADQVGNGRFRPRYDHRRRPGGQSLARPNEDHVDTRFAGERIEIVEIGDPVEHGHGDGHTAARAARHPLQRDGILRRQPRRVLQPGQHPERTPARMVGDRCQPVIEQGHVAAEFVDQETADHRPVLLRQDSMRSDQRGDHPAPVDIADEHDRDIRGRCKTHICNIAGP